MAQGACSERRAVGGLTAGQERKKEHEKSNVHRMPAGSGTRVLPRASIDHICETTRRDKAIQKEKQMKIFKTTSVALLSSLLIGVASMPARSATVEDQTTVVE